MKNVFQRDDIVYHPRFGEARIVCDPANEVYASIYIKSTGNVLTYHVDEISFSPWPPANHERPLKDGKYCKTTRGGWDQFVIRKDGQFYYAYDGEANIQILDSVVAEAKFTYLGD